MRLVRNLDRLPDELRTGAVSIGNFDGVHKGHARIIDRLLAWARQVGGPAVVFTFDPHPVRLLRPEVAPPPLTWTDRKVQLLAELGVDAMIAYPTDRALLSLTPEQFFQQVVREQLDARAVVEGPNFYFGRDRAGDVNRLREFCERASIGLEIVPPLMLEGDLVSSSRIRRLVAEGHVDQAWRLLTRPYRIRGMVTHGARRGVTLGFPTANLEAIDTLLPAHGVYAGVAITGAGNWPAAIHIGPNPTFGEGSTKVEVHLIGFSGSLYGLPIEVDCLARLRGIERFTSVDQLRQQLQEDVRAAERIVLEHSYLLKEERPQLSDSGGLAEE